MMLFFRPDRYYISVLDIDPCELLQQGYRAIILDLDNTILPRTQITIPNNLLSWVQTAKSSGIKLCFLSNNWHKRIREAAFQADVGLVVRALKPLIHGFIIARHKMGSCRRETIVIGDQTFTDILGAHMAGMKAILVQPLCKQDLWHTRLLRRLDRFFLKGLKPKGTTVAFMADEKDKALL